MLKSQSPRHPETSTLRVEVEGPCIGLSPSAYAGPGSPAHAVFLGLFPRDGVEVSGPEFIRSDLIRTISRAFSP